MATKNKKALFFWVSSLALCAAFATSLLFREKSAYNILISSSLSWEALGQDRYFSALSSFRQAIEPSSEDNYKLISLRSPRYLSSSLLKLTIMTDQPERALEQIGLKLRALSRADSGAQAGELRSAFQSGGPRLLDVEKIFSPPFHLRALQVLVLCGALYFALFVAPSISVKTFSLVIIAISAVVLTKVSFSFFKEMPRFEGVRIQTPSLIWSGQDGESIHPEEIAYSLLRARFDEGEVVSVIPDSETRTLHTQVKLIDSEGLDLLSPKIRTRVARFLEQAGIAPEKVRIFEKNEDAVRLIPGAGESLDMESARSRIALICISLVAFIISSGICLRYSVKS